MVEGDFWNKADVEKALEGVEARAGDIRRSCADLGKAEKLLGYKPKTSLREGLTMLLGDLGV